MSDRDIPSVPVTTLAGLNSLSDLLSELPVAESLSNATNLDRSLLFHTLVANESNNLLSLRDDTLVKQLVNAIEQTNSDNIELKPQYIVAQNATNLSTYPELLQGIYNCRPTVFNTASCETFKNLPSMSETVDCQKSNLLYGNSSAGMDMKVGSEKSSENELSQNQKAVDPGAAALKSKEPTVTQQNRSCQQESVEVTPRRSSRRNISDQATDKNTGQMPPEDGNKKGSNNTGTSQNTSNLYANHTVEMQQQRLHENQEQIKNTGSYQSNQQSLGQNSIQQTTNMGNNAMVEQHNLVATNTALLDNMMVHQNSFHFPDQFKSEKESLESNIIHQNNQMVNQIEQGQQVENPQTNVSPNETNVKHEINDHFLVAPQQTLNVNTGGKDDGCRDLNNTGQVPTPELRTMKVNTADPNAAIPADNISQVRRGNNVEAAVTTSSETTKNESDTFTQMKADEKRTASKRKISAAIPDMPPEQIYTKPKLRKVERIKAAAVPKWSKEEITKSQTYQQFMRNMDQIIELLDDTESPNFDVEEVDENVECISAKMLHTMSNDVAKLKAKHALDSIPKNKLTLLINYAMRNIYLAKNYSAGTDDDDDIVDDEVMDRILNALEACLLICNIYATVNDLKFLQEDNISLIIKFVQFQFRETIFPSFDPVYTVKNMKKSDGRKKQKGLHNHHRNLQLFYSKSVELMKVFVTLFDKCIFVDTIVLPLSTVAIEPFFVDNIDTLQFVCLELVTTIFRKEKYEKIRSSILQDILASIDRLPSSKKNLRPFKLANNVGNIQMVSALVLQLIQCATILPETLCEKVSKAEKESLNLMDEKACDSVKSKKTSHDIVILKKYDVAISIGGNFLTTFLNKCKSRSSETDFRPLFENFIHDLLATVNKPEWPASELLLSLLGTMLVRYVSDKSIEQSIRLVSLDYLGIVAARLRKDTVESRCKVHIIDSMIKSIKLEQEKEGDLSVENSKIELDVEEERTVFLQNILLDFLAVNAQEENLIWDYARHFYLAQWYRDIIYQRRRIAEGEKPFATKRKTNKRRRKGGSLESSDSSSSEGNDEDGSTIQESGRNIDHELNVEFFNILDERKQYLLRKIKPYAIGDVNHTSQQHIKTYIDYNNANLIAQYLATKRPFSQSFDGYLKKIILVVNEPSIAVRTRAMKCLANIVEVDPMVLKRKDMQMGVNQKFLDAAISVREAAVDLVGKFVLSNEELIDQYYDMLSTRILDTGVSVRKRVIKILRDICIEYPDFQKIPEICVKMIRRVNDEEGIQKLVTEVFMKMWFVPCSKNDRYGIQRKINQIIDVVNTAHDTGTTWLEGLLISIFQPKENLVKLEGASQELIKKNTEPLPEIVLACQQLADGLVDRLIELEDTDNNRMLGCITTLHLLAKVRPQLLVRHAMTIEPYLNIKCHPSTAPKFICSVADILEKVVPLVNNASESFLATLEEHLMILVVSFNQAVVTSCVSCLGALINKITKNYKLIRDCFQKFYRVLDYSKNQVIQNNHSIDSIYTPMFRRSLFTIGILMRYFNFRSSEVIGETNGLPNTICDDAFEGLMFFVQCSNNEIRKQALIALGSFCVMNDDYLTKAELKNFYCDLLRLETNEASVKIICMRNIWMYLTESEMYMHNKEKEWEKQSKNEDLKEMNDVSSGMASRIIQLYLQEILNCFLHRDDAVRLWAVKVVQIVLRQGLVHPVRMVPYLICLSTDSKIESAHRADALLKEIDKTYSGFVNMKVQFGLQLCFQLQEVLQMNSKDKCSSVIRGYSKRPNDSMPTALNDFLYTLLRTTKPQRRALVQTVTKQFDDQRTSLRQMLYIADNLAYFPYVVQDEPLYLIHQIDLLISMAGTNLLSTFKECLKPGENNADILADDDDEEDPNTLLKRLPDDTSEVQKCITSAQACMLLLILKDHLKEMYGLTDGKISRYSPSEPKIYEKAVTRKVVQDFNPKNIIDLIKQQQLEQSSTSVRTEKSGRLTDEEKMDIVIKYLDFKQLMLKLDPEDLDSDEDFRDKSQANKTVPSEASVPPSVTVAADGSTVEAENILDPNRLDNSANSSIANRNAVNSYPSVQKDMSSASRASRSAGGFQKTGSSSPMKKQQRTQRTKRRKRKVVSSDDEADDDDYCSDECIP